MVETIIEKAKAEGMTQTPLLDNMPLYRQLFELKYYQNIREIKTLCELLDLSDLRDVEYAEKKLDQHLNMVLHGKFTPDRLDMLCPFCLTLTLTTCGSEGQEIKPTCSKCGLEVTDMLDFDNFNQDLDREVTFAPESKISYTNGLGCTFSPNADPQHKNLLWQIVNERNILFSELKKNLPVLAFKFRVDYLSEGEYEVVEDGDYVYCHIGAFVRRVTKVEYYFKVKQFKGVCTDDELAEREKVFWHEFDAPLQNSKLKLMIDPKSRFKRAKEYGLFLCEKYGFNHKLRDQAIYNSVGAMIEKYKPFVESLERHVSEKAFAETVFYVNLLKFRKSKLAVVVRSDLEIKVELVNFFEDVELLLNYNRLHPNYDTALIQSLEKKNGIS